MAVFFGKGNEPEPGSRGACCAPCRHPCTCNLRATDIGSGSLCTRPNASFSRASGTLIAGLSTYSCGVPRQARGTCPPVPCTARPRFIPAFTPVGRRRASKSSYNSCCSPITSHNQRLPWCPPRSLPTVARRTAWNLLLHPYIHTRSAPPWRCGLAGLSALYDNHDWILSVKTSYRATASVIALAIASLTVPSLAQAKRMGGGKTVRPASIGSAPAKPATPPPPRLRPSLPPRQPPRLRPPPPQHRRSRRTGPRRLRHDGHHGGCRRGRRGRHHGR
jgi:hypothetical protein